MDHGLRTKVGRMQRRRATNNRLKLASDETARDASVLREMNRSAKQSMLVGEVIGEAHPLADTTLAADYAELYGMPVVIVPQRS